MASRGNGWGGTPLRMGRPVGAAAGQFGDGDDGGAHILFLIRLCVVAGGTDEFRGYVAPGGRAGRASCLWWLPDRSGDTIWYQRRAVRPVLPI